MKPPILVDFADSFETSRLLLRAPRQGDGAELNAAVLESLDELRPWMAWASGKPSLPESEAHARERAAEFVQRADLPLFLYLKGTSTLVGCSGLHRMDWSVPRFEIGYWCRTRFVGQGYVTEAVRGIADFAFDALGAQRIEIRCDPRNERSVRVAERCGFHLEGTLRNESLAPAGGLRDTRVYSLIPADRTQATP